MKIIGSTAEGYLVEATSDELAHAAGYRTAYEAPGWNRNSGSSYHSLGAFPIGTKIKVTDAYRFMNELRTNEDKVRDSAAQLKALAQMISAALPTTVVPPPSKPSMEETAS